MEELSTEIAGKLPGVWCLAPAGTLPPVVCQLGLEVVELSLVVLLRSRDHRVQGFAALDPVSTRHLSRKIESSTICRCYTIFSVRSYR